MRQAQDVASLFFQRGAELVDIFHIDARWGQKFAGVLLQQAALKRGAYQGIAVRVKAAGPEADKNVSRPDAGAVYGFFILHYPH